MRYIAPLLVSGLLLAPVAAFADQPMPSGSWQCEGAGNCVDINTISQDPPLASAQGIVHDQGHNKRGVIVKNCDDGRVTTTGVEGMAENWPIQADFRWMCRR